MDYRCADCGHAFPVVMAEAEVRGALRNDHDERCPRCGQRVGRGFVACRRCRQRYEVRLPHAHVVCSVADGVCPSCGTRHVSACVC